MPTCYLVVGTPRSGTSLVSGLLHLSGIPMGERLPDEYGKERWDFPDPNEWNPKGFFTDTAIENLLNRWLGSELYNVEYKSDDKMKSDLESILISRSKASGADWGIKSNRICCVLNDIVELCPDEIKVIRVNRDIDKSIASWSERSKDSEEKSRLIIESCNKAIDECLNSIDLPLLSISFDELIDNENYIEQISLYIKRDLKDISKLLIDQSLRRF